MNKVVVSGIGIISALGDSKDSVWRALLAGKSGIKCFPESYKDLMINGVCGGGYISDVNLTGFEISNEKLRLVKGSEKTTKMLIHAGLSALADANIRYPGDLEEYNMGMIVGTGISTAERYRDIPYPERNPKWFLETYPNIHLAYFSILVSLKGFCSSIVSACVSSSQAIGAAFRMIRKGEAEVMLAGGVDSKFAQPFIYGFSQLNMMDTREDLVNAMRPFDKDRNGFVMGEGACVLVLESYDHLKKRNGRALCEIAGYGNSMDANSLTNSNWQGKYRAMEVALHDADLSIQDIDYINAHGTATYSNDKEESIAIKKLFGKHAYSIPINSTKSMTGHTFAACGAIEAAVCTQSIIHDQIHTTLNFMSGDDDCDLNYVEDRFIEKEITYCISNNSAIGGYNTTLVFKKIS